MKKIMSLLLVALLSTISVLADDVSQEHALQIASQFAAQPSTKNLSRSKASAVAPSPTLAHSVKSKVASGKDNVYVVNLGADQGFVIVSGESGTGDEVLGYCDHGSFNYDNCPVQLKDLLTSYSTTIDSLRQNPSLAAPRRVVGSWPDYIGSIVVGPLLTTTWNQWAPYNDLCPAAQNEGMAGNGGRAPSGCYPTALAQVMNYWKWPEKTIGTVSGEDFSGHTYDWDNMLDDYSNGYNSTQANAVAQLMADIGKAFGTQYGQPNGSPTSFSSLQLEQNFNYQSGIERKYGLTAADLQEVMKKELDEMRPVLYCGYPDFEKTKDPHALVCDGYTSNDFFHFNYGWGGSCDGFYKNAITPNYQYATTILTGVRPYDAVRKTIDGIEYGLLKNGTAEILDYTLGKGGSENGELVLPAVVKDDDGNEYKVTRIVKHAFYQKGHFTKLTLGDNIETIDRYAIFYTDIDELVLSDKMEEVPDESFYTIPISRLTIGASIKRIGYRAFALSSLATVTCKSPAFEVGDQAFFMCMNLDSGDWLGSITKIGKRAFAGIRFATQPDFKKLVEVDSEAFLSCTFPKNSFTIPTTLKRISPDAFDSSTLSWFRVTDNPNFYCSDDAMGYLCNSSGTSLVMTVPDPILTLGDPNMDEFPANMVRMEPGSIRSKGKVYIPASIVEMEGAFKDCSSFSALKSLAPIPPDITEATFGEKFFDDVPWLYVPAESVELYENAPVWNRFYVMADDRDYETVPKPDRQYNMVVSSTDEQQQRVSIPISEVSSMRIADDGQHVVIKRSGKEDLIVPTAAVDSVSWVPGFVMDNAEVFELNDSTLTVEAQKCTVKFDATCIDSDVQLCVRNSVLTPKVTEDVTRGFAVDLSLSNDEHELSGTVDITIPVSPEGGERVCAAYYNEAEGQWEPVRFEYDEAMGTVTITTNHLSMYSIFYTKNDFTPRALLDIFSPLPTLYDFDEATKKLFDIISSDDPDTQMALEFKDEMGFWQSVGLDGIYNAVTSISEPLLDFKPEALDNAVTAMGYLGTAISILDVMRADIQGDDLGVAKGAMSTVLNFASGQMAAAIGTPIMAAASCCTAFIGIALDKLYTSVMEHKRDMFREAYRYYYSQKGFNALIGDSRYKIDDKNPHGYYRTTKDWYNHFYPIITEGKLTKDKLEGVIEQTVRMYCERFWDDNEAVRTWAYEYAKTQGLSTYMNISESDMEQISNEYYAELMNGEMVSVIAAIKRHVEIEAEARCKKAMERVAAIVNTKYRLAISDSSRPAEGKSKFAGWKMRFANISSTVNDEKQWECTIGDDGTASLGYVTVYSLLQNEMPFEVVLCDRNGVEKKTWKFGISENTGKRVIKVDLATSGVEVEAPKLSDLILTYDPDFIKIPWTWDGYLYEYDINNNLVKKPVTSSGGAIEIRLDGSFNKRARFQYEIEKFFKRHDFIVVDQSGHIKIGDDIVGTMTGNEGSGKFTINTTHKFVEKTVPEFVKGFNQALSGGDIMGIFSMLNGTISHKIDCEFTVVRNEADDSYAVTYTGTGTYNTTVEGVALIENFNFSAFNAHQEQKITVNDVSTGITEAEGTVTLNYTTVLQ